jgi:nucleoid-associated protein YgaU
MCLIKMNFSNIKSKLKNKINDGADRYLSAKLKDELGLNKPTIESLQALSENPNIGDELNTFYKPVDSTFLSAKDYKNIQKWSVSFIVILTIALVFLFFSMIMPQKNYSNSLANSQIMVGGNLINKVKEPEAKIIEELSVEDEEPTEELIIENIKVGEEDTGNLAKSSPLLKSEAVSIVEYTIRSGDTLELIAQKFYGNSGPSFVDKIKVANKIRDVRLIQVGQKLIIPM